MVLTCALTLAVNHYFELRVTVFLCIFFSVLPAAGIYLFDMNRKNTVSYLVIFSAFPILAFIFWIKKFNPIYWTEELIAWCNIYDGSEKLNNQSYARFIIFAVALVGSILFYLLMKKQAAKIALGIIFLLVMVALSVSQVDIDKIVVCIFIFYILTILVELCGIIYSKKAGRQDKRAGILYLAPICLLLAILSVSLPSRPEPIQWKGIKLLYNNVREKFDTWMVDLEYYFSKSESDFAISLTGYDEESGELGSGGQLSKDERTAMLVSGYKESNPVYLIGSVSDIYTGNSWEKSKEDRTEGEEEYFLDYSELVNALARQEVGIFDEQDLVKRRYLNIRFYNLKTKTCFYPLKSSWIDIKTKKSKPQADYSSIMFPRALGRGTNYQVVSYEMNLEGQAFQEMLRNADTFSYSEEPKVSGATVDWLGENILYQDNVSAIDIWESYDLLKQRAENIHKLYTVLPNTLPNRVKELAVSITEEYDTTYDKLKAIESYLNTYPYTLTPGGIPEGQDFVDYFLFENKKGYCTSFASALAVLGRCIGVPTRYVEGFVVTYQGKYENDMYPVKNSQTHAWAEAYIEGVGWIPFEATSPFLNVRYTKWKEKVIAQGGGSTEPTNRYDYHRPEEMPNLTPLEIPILVEKERNNNVITGVIIFLATILIIIWILFIYYSILRLKYKKAFVKADYSTKMYMLFLRILRILQREGYVLHPQETILMLAHRVKDKFRYESITFTTVANIFMHYRYAQAEVTKEEYDQVNNFHKELVNKQLEERNRFNVLLDEFFFLVKKSNR
jgi:hypothetical protein